MEQEILRGSTTLLNSDNIAIVALSVAFFISVSFNWYLIRNLFKMKDVLQALTISISLLNERLDHRPKNRKQ